MSVLRRLLAPLLVAACMAGVPTIAGAADLVPPLKRSDLDPTAFSAWVDGAVVPLPADKLTGNDTPMWTSDGQAGWTGIEYGDTKKPGARHMRIGFTKAITIGSAIVRGGNFSVLKATATYPGDLADESQWLPAQRLSDAGVSSTADMEEIVTWVLPVGTSTRALRFTHLAKPTDRRYNGWLGGVWLLSERFANLAPAAIPTASGNTDVAARVNDQRSNNWDTWDNGEHGQEHVVSEQHPAWLTLAWPQAQTISGLMGLSVGASRIEAQVCTAPADRSPAQADESQWRTVVPALDADPLYPKPVGPIVLTFPQAETTRGVRVRFLRPIDESRSHGHLGGKSMAGKRIWLTELLALTPLGSKPLVAPVAPVAVVENPPIAIPFRLDRPGFVTLVIDDTQGNRIRNLVSETHYPAGDNTAWWDGLDDRGRDYDAAEHHQYRIPGALVPPATYRVRGLVRDDLSLTYEFSFYTNGTPPWETADGTGWWLGNHSPPQAAWFVPAGQTRDGKESMLIGSFITEGGSGLAWLDLDGRKRHGIGWIGGHWTGAAFITGDRGSKPVPTWYAYTGAAFEGELRLNGLRPAGGDDTVLKWNFPSKGDSDLGGIAVHDGVLVASLTKLNALMFVDVAAARVLGQVPCTDPRGVAFDAKGGLLVLSGKQLLRLTLPNDLLERGSGKALDRSTWSVSASSGNAAQAIDGKDDTRWDTQQPQKTGAWFQIDLGKRQAVGRLILDARRSEADFPRAYALTASDDGKTWSKPLVTGNGTPGLLDVALPAGTTTRFLRLTLTADFEGHWWSMNELRATGAAAGLGTIPSAVVVAKGLEDPRGICTEVGRIYIADHGTSHQVKVFGDNGAPQRTIGKAGVPTVGPYDPLHMNQPMGMAVDSKGRLWVTECDHQPKRVSIWKADGTFERAFYGPARYGEGGTVDTADKKRLFLMGMEFALDWTSGKDAIKHVYWRPHRGLDLGGEFGPELLLSVQGREYLTNVFNAGPTNAPGVVGLWSYVKGIATPVAAAGRARDFAALAECFAKLREFSVRWTGKVVPTITGPVSFHTVSDDGVRLWIDGKLVIDNWKGHGPTEDTGVVTLSANKAVDVKLEWFQGSGGACIKLLWSGASLPKAIIPAKSLIPAGATAAGGLRGEFFFGQNFERSAFVRNDATIEIDVVNGASIPVPGKEADAAAMQARLPAGTEFERDSLLFTWSDRNHDGKLNADELTFRKDDVGGMTVQPDLSLTTSTGLLLKPTGFDSAGVPLYDVANAVALVPGGRAPNTSGGGHTLVCADGWTVLTIPPEPFPAQSSLSGAKDGVLKWTYPNLWPGLHPSHHAPAPDRPGQIIGTTRVVGHPFKPTGTDTVCWAINGNKGNVYVLTTDGLFVATLFKDSRMFPRWAMPAATRGTRVEQTSLGEENFWPTMTQTADGKICLVSGSSVVSVGGLESIRRLPEIDLPLSVAQLTQAQNWTLEQEAKRQQALGSGSLHVVLRSSAPTVDGGLDDWTGAQWATIDRRREQTGDFSSKTELITGAVSVSGDRLYAAWKTADGNLLRSAGTTWQTLFKFGGALDLMIGADPSASSTRREPVAGDRRLLVTLVNGKPLAVLYTPVVPTHVGDRFQFVSPVSTLLMDEVTQVTDQIQVAGKDGNFELSVPLSLLGLKPVAGKEIKADIGLLRGNGFATMQRVYWSNKATSITSDIPSEARLSPNLWGRWVFTTAP